jgi:hypothetical protein
MVKITNHHNQHNKYKIKKILIFSQFIILIINFQEILHLILMLFNFNLNNNKKYLNLKTIRNRHRIKFKF